jgi:RNA polymerase sigma factor (sigma-70 family)
MSRSWKDQFLASVVALHGRPLMRFFVSRLPNAADAPDLVQEVYLRLIRLERADLIKSPEAYLFTIASNIVREHHLKRSNVPPHIALDDTPPDELPADIDTYNTAAPEDAAVQAHRIRQLERTLGQLSPKARATLIWHRRDGHTYNEIAQRLGVSRNMIKKYLSQALAHCRKALETDEGK